MARMTICGHCMKPHDDTKRCPCRIKAGKQRNKEKNINSIETTKFYKSAAWRKLRLAIINRDESHCQRCFIKYNVITTSLLQVHHIKPRVSYPELRFEKTNLICLCQTCNLELGESGKLDFPFKFPEERDSFTL